MIASGNLPMIFRANLLALICALSCVWGWATPVSAQVTTAGLRGSVVDAAGNPVKGANILLEHAQSQTQKTSLSSASGEFAFNGLRVGGPYKLKVSHVDYPAVERGEIFLQAGSNEAITLRLGKTEVMQVVGTRAAPVSQKSFYGASDIRNAPSSSGDPKDIVRNSADVYVDGQALSIGGANSRFNSVTIDGMRQDDDFGLNGNGYPTQRSPISLQSVAEITVERSPFDVRYGNFLGGNVNVVTKSGGNDFEGSVSITHSNQDLAGDKSKNISYGSDFSEQRLGLTLGGPIIEDKLHFFVSAEGLQASTPATVGVAGSGQPTEVTKVTAEDVARAQEIAARVYDFRAGDPAQSLDEDDLKFLAKIDWTINDAHRLEAKYQQSTGTSINDGTANETNLPLTSSWYKKRDTLEASTLRLFSDWNDKLSSKVEVSRKKVLTEQDPLEGNGFMSAEIETAADGRISLGPDRFRHTNELENESLHFGSELTYLLGAHQITAGVEKDEVDIFNLFVPGSNGVARYDSLDDFEARRPSRLEYSNSVTNNPRDASASFKYGVNTLYIQDELQLDSQWTARFGLRGEFYEASDTIARNDNFLTRHGFDNTATVDGKQVLLPRLGLSYKASDRLQLRTGVGLYAGGTPNVWLSNSYTNTGISIDSETTTTADGFDGRNIPDDLKNRLQAGDGNVDALDPDFEIPQTLKLSLGSNYRFDIPQVADKVNFDFDYTYSKVRQGLIWKDLKRDLGSIPNNLPQATAPDGRAIYDTDVTTASATDFNIDRGYDLLMGNTDKGYGQTASFSLSKNWNSGLSLGTSYAWQRIFEVNPGTSSTASSNYSQFAVGVDPNNPDLSRSSFERTHRFVLSAGYEKSFFESLATNFNLFFERRSGQPYSYTFGGRREQVGALFGESSAFSGRNRQLFYVPKGDGSDVILEGIDEAQFNAFLKKSGLDRYRGKIAPRNAFTSDWVELIDARVSQELPTFGAPGRARFVLDIRNLPNFLNKNWGQVKQAPFPYYSRVVDVKYDAASGRYRYSNFNTSEAQTVRSTESIWKMQVAVVYDF